MSGLGIHSLTVGSIYGTISIKAASLVRSHRLVAKARRNPAGLRFEELCRLAESAGFEFVRHRGSHRIYRHPVLGKTLSVQDFRGEAKPYQVRQLLTMIDEAGDPDV